MKRLFFILLFFGGLFCLSCQTEYGILEYQSKDLVAECKINGKYTVEIAKVGKACTIRVLEPENAKDITFTVGESVTLAASDMELKMEREELSGICALAGIFSQSEDCLTSATQKGEGSVLTFQSEGCVYQITLGKSGMPNSVYIVSESFEYEVEILSIELKTKILAE